MADTKPILIDAPPTDMPSRAAAVLMELLDQAPGLCDRHGPQAVYTGWANAAGALASVCGHAERLDCVDVLRAVATRLERGEPFLVRAAAVGRA